MIRFYRGRTTGHYLDGRPVRVFGRVGRWFAHLELGSRSFSLFLGR